MIDLEYSIVIEATEDPTFFGFYAPDIPGFTGIGHSIEDCIYQAKWALKEHMSILEKQGLPLPQKSEHPTILIQNELTESVSI